MTTAMDDSRRAYPARPLVDECSAAVLDEAVASLTILRSPMYVGDAGAELHALASLRGQIEARLSDAVVAARDQLVPWSVIGAQLGLNAGDARHIYGPCRVQHGTDICGRRSVGGVPTKSG